MILQQLLGIELPVIQAPMAGVQDHRLALAVSGAGGLGSLPAALLSLEALRSELIALKTQTDRPFNVNFFCHQPIAADALREAAWRKALAPYYREFGIDPAGIPAGPGRQPFDARAADLVEEFRPAVVSFHFGLPANDLLARVKATGAFVISSRVGSTWPSSRTRSGDGRILPIPALTWAWRTPRFSSPSARHER